MLRRSVFRENWPDWTRGEATSGGDRKFHLCLFLLDFRDHWAPPKWRDARKKRGRTQGDQSCSTLRQMWPRDFELSQPSQFCNRAFGVFTDAAPYNYGDAGQGSEILSRIKTGPAPAEELSKGWRFFPTYAGVQTSTVL